MEIPSDRIGGTAKQLVARASLQATERNHILTPEYLCKWAKESILHNRERNHGNTLRPTDRL
jgi:hypothetical protein